MLRLFLTFLRITLLRCGPEALPASPLFLGAALALWLSATLLFIPLLDTFNAYSVFVSMLSQAVSLGTYSLVLEARNAGSRRLPTLTAVAGASAMITLAMVAWLAFIAPLLSQSVVGFGPLLLVVWAVQVEGHIIARAIDTGLVPGIAIAACVFIIQYSLETYLTTL